MARQLSEIFDSLKSDFVANPTIQSFYGIPSLSTFDTEFSLVSFERALLYIISIWIFSIETNIDDLQTQVEAEVERSRRWSIPMMVEDALNFQLGENLVWLNGDYRYLNDLPATRIVKLASATEVGNSVTMKIANQDGNNLPFPLSNSELAAFQIYMNLLKAPGVDLQIVSRAADLLKLNLRVYVNPLVIDTNGSSLINPSIRPVDDAIVAYCRNGIDFAGKFSVTELLDALQLVNGVVSPIFDSAEAKYGILPYSPFVDYYTPFAGYLEIDPAFPLTTSIQYFVAP
jgi:hypothetical protein